MQISIRSFPFILAVCVAFFFLSFFAVQADARLIVSNTGQTDATGAATALADGHIHAQRFSMPNGADPYKVTNVSFGIRSAAPSASEKLTVAIQRASSGDPTLPDGIDLASREVAGADSTGAKTVDFTTDTVTLKPGVDYFVVFTYNGAAGDNFSLTTTTSNDEDTVGVVTGVTIRNNYMRSTDSGSAWSTGTGAIEISVNGDEGHILYLKDGSDTGNSPNDRRTFDYTPTVVLSGFTGTVNLVATASSETNVTATRDGDGEVTLPRLTPGKLWTITATEAATPANTATLAVHVDNLLVGNLNLGLPPSSHQLGGGGGGGEHRLAQGFTVDAGSYALEEIQYFVGTAAADHDNRFSISVQGVDNGGNPDGNKLATINVDHDVLESVGTKTTALDTPLVLATDTTYFIVFEYVGEGAGFHYGTWYEDRGGVSRHSEEPSATGWSLSDSRLHSSGTSWVSFAAARPTRMALIGSLVPTQTVDLHSDSDTGMSNTDNITSDDTPTITVAGFASDDNITVVATKVGTTTTVEETGRGDNDYTLPELSDGKWYIIAHNVQGERTLRIAVTIDSDNPDLLVKNTGQTASSTGFPVGGSTSIKRAQQFTTGAGASTLEQVQYHVHTAASDANNTFTISIQAVSGSNPDGTAIASINVDHDEIETTGLKTATFATPVALAANTSYFVVFESTSSPLLSGTASNSEDAGGVQGWSIADGVRQHSTSGSGWGDSTTLLVGLYGSEIPLSVDLKSGSDSGSSQTDNITNDTTPTVTVSGFADDATITVTAAHPDSSVDDVTVTKSDQGNGDVDLTTLVEGVWSITASDGTNTSPALSVTIDTTIPDATVSATNFTGHLSSTDLYINKADADATSGDILTAPTQSFTYSYKVVGSTVDCDSNVSYASDIPETSDVSTDGTYKICIKAEDTAGNIQYLATPTFTRDIAPPATPVAPDLDTASDSGSSNSDNITSDKTPTVTTPTVANATYEWTIDGTVSTTLTAASITTADLSDGDHTFSVKVTDQAGNQSSASPDLTVTVDTTKPTLSNILDLETVYTRTPTFTFTSSEAGAITWGGSCSSSTTAAVQGGNTITFNTLALGTRSDCTIVVRDAAGNDSDTGTIPAFTVSAGAISIAMSQATPAQSRSATATVTGTTITGLKWRLFDPTLDTPETCDSTLDFTSAESYTSGVAVTVANAEADNDKKVCFTATIEGSAVYQASDAIADIDRTPPTAPGTPDLAQGDDTGSSNTDNITKKTTGLTFTVAATGENGGTVRLYNGSSAVGTATTVSGGSASIDISLAEGTHTITAKTTDQAGNVSLASTPVTVTVDTTKPTKPTTPDLAQGSDTGVSNTDNITNDDTPAISTTAVANATYEWTVDGSVVAAYTAASITSTALTDGDHTFSVKVTDRAGNQSDASDTLTITVDDTDPSAPTGLDLDSGDDTGSSNTDNITNKTSGLTITVTATGENGGKVQLYNGNTAVGPATVIAANKAAIDIALSEGTHSITAKTTDKAGNVSTASSPLSIKVDTTSASAPGTPDLAQGDDTGSSNTDNITKNTSNLTFTVAAAGENGGKVQLYRAGTTPVGTATTISGGSASIDISLAEGTHSITAKTTDAAGNAASDASSPLTVTVDTTKPTKPTTPDLAQGSDTGVSNTDNITNDDTPAISTTAVANATYEWTVDGSVVAAYTAASITTTTLTDGDHTFSVKVTDRAGNQSDASDTLTITVDDTDPSAPTGLDLDSGDDTGSSNTDNITNKTSGLTIAVTATGENGGKVQLYRAGTTPVGTATTISGGSASIDISLAEGTHSITAKTTDKAGNVSTSSSPLSIKVDTSAPVAPSSVDLTAASDTYADINGNSTYDAGVDHGSNTDNITKLSTLVFTMSGLETGASLTITADPADTGNNNVTKTHTDSSASSFNLENVTANDTYSVTVTQTDVAGNVSAASTALSVTKDSAAPTDNPTIDLQSGSDTGVSQTDNYTNATSLVFDVASITEDDLYLVLKAGSSTLQSQTGGHKANGTDNSITLTYDNSAKNEADTTMKVVLYDKAGNTREGTGSLTIYPDYTVGTPLFARDNAKDTGASTTDGITNSKQLGFVVGNVEVSATNRGNGAEVTIYDDSDTTNPQDGTAIPLVAEIGHNNAAVTTSNSNTVATTKTNFADGKHTFYACQEDDAGNISCSSAQSWVVDTTAPSAPSAPDLHEDDDSQGVNVNGARDGTKSDDVTNIQQNLDFASTASGSQTETNGAHDQHQIRFYLWTPASSSDTTVGDDELAELKSLAITAASNIGTISNTGYTANGQRGTAKQLYTTGADILAEGTHYFVAKQYDVAGNLSAVSAALKVIVDITAPGRVLVEPVLHPISDSGTSNEDKQTSSLDLIFTFTPSPTSNASDIDYFEVRRVRLDNNLATVSGESYAYPSSPTSKEQTSYEYFAGTKTDVNDLVEETDDTLGKGAYSGGGAVRITGMDVPHYNTWYAFTIYSVDLAGNVRQGANSTNVRILVPPPTPATMDLAVASDSGAEDDDNVTNETSWTLSGKYQNTATAEQTNDAAAGVKRVVVSVEQLDSEGQAAETLTHTFTRDTDFNADNDITTPAQGSPNNPYTYSFTFDATDFEELTDGAYRVTAIAYNSAGEASSASDPLVITLDRIAPVPEEHITVRTTVFISGSSGQTLLFRYANPSGNEPNAHVTVSNADGSWTGDIDSADPTEIRAGDFIDPVSTYYTVVYTDAAGNISEKMALKTSSLPPMVTSYVTDPGTDTKFVVIGVAADGTALTTAVTYDQHNGLCNAIGDKANPDTLALSEIVTVSTDYCVEVQDAGGNIRAIRIKGDKSNLIANAEVLDEDDNGRSVDDRVTNDPNPRYRATTLPGASVRMQSRVQATPVNAFSNIQTITAHADTGAFTLSGILPRNAVEDSVIELQGYVRHTALGDAEIGPVTLPAVTIDLTDPVTVSDLFGTNLRLLASDDTGTSNSDRITSEDEVVIQEVSSIYTTDNAAEGDKLILTNTKTEETQYIIISQSVQNFDPFTLTGDGTHTFTAVTEDLAGNRVSYDDSYTITLDSTDPNITIIRLNDPDTTIDANTRFIAVASDDTTTTFSYVIETKTACGTRSAVAGTAYTAGTVFDPDETNAALVRDGICFIARDVAGNISTKHTMDAIEGVGSFAIQGGTQVAGTIYTTSGSKTITGVSAPNARVLIKVAPNTDDPTTYTDTQLRSTSFATTTFTIPAGETAFSQTLNLSSGDTGKQIIGWIWTDKDDATTATPAIQLTTLTIDDQAPTITPGTITSDNSNPAFAKQGDVITATFTTNEIIAAHTAVINGLPATCTDSNNSFSCTATLTNAADEGVATLVASVTDRAGNTTTNTFTNPGITIDATAPAVAVSGISSKHFKATGTENITITITDSNEIQAGTYTITATGATLSTCTLTVPASTNTVSKTCTLTTASATDGTPVVLTIPTLVDASGNSKASHSITLGYVDTRAPQISQPPIPDTSKRRKLTFTLDVTHNQHASNTNPETLTPVFSGDCSKFNEPKILEDTDWTGIGSTNYETTLLSVPKGTYETCTVAVMDEAGNTSPFVSFASEFEVRGDSGGGVRSGDVENTDMGPFYKSDLGVGQAAADFYIFGGSSDDSSGLDLGLVPDTALDSGSGLGTDPDVDLGAAAVFTRNLTVGSVGEDVRALQQILNNLGFIISESGAGSPGQESTYFGERTRQALIRYQQANGISPAQGYFGPLTRASILEEQFGQPAAETTDGVRSSIQDLDTNETAQRASSGSSRRSSQDDETSEEQETAQDEPVLFTRDLTIGSVGEDVRALQKLLNNLGFIISETGAGSPGQESTYFGERTRQALIRYQIANGISPAQGYFGPLTRASIVGQSSGQQPEGEVRSSIEEQEQSTEDYEPVTEILYRPSLRLPSFRAPQF